MDPNRLYSYLMDMDWLFLIGYSLFITGMLVFASDLWPSLSRSDEKAQVPMR
jgi:hypothetical protein